MKELHEHRIKRLKMRSMRRGIKEMDLILQRFSERHLDDMTEAELSLYDDLLSENDQDLYQWVTRQVAAPSQFVELMEQIIRDLPQTSV